MLVIVKGPQGYYLGRDTRLKGCDGVANDSSLQDNDLIFPSYDDPDTIIGVEGEIRVGYYLRYLGDMLPAPGKTLTMKYMVSEFVPKFYDALVKFKYADKDESPRFEAKIIIARKNKAFLISKDASVEEIGDEEVIGEGSKFADGILVHTEGQDPFKRIMKTFDYVSHHCFSINRNVIVCKTDKPHNWRIYDSDDLNKLSKN